MSERAPCNRTMECADGSFFDYDAPHWDIEWMATHLSCISRYNGAGGFYSDAEHCVLVSLLADDEFEGLMHDAHESVMHDINSPLKRRPDLRGYRRLERRIYQSMAAHFGLAPEMSDNTHWADNAASYIESEVLLPSRGRHWPEYAEHKRLHRVIPIHRWNPEQARQAFLLRYHQLMERRGLTTSKLLQEAVNG